LSSEVRAGAIVRSLGCPSASKTVEDAIVKPNDDGSQTAHVLRYAAVIYSNLVTSRPLERDFKLNSD